MKNPTQLAIQICALLNQKQHVRMKTKTELAIEINELLNKNNMYKPSAPQTTMLKHNTSVEGETIEQKVNRIMNNGDPITDGAPQIYTERIEGVIPEYNIRSDRFDLALDAQEKIVKQRIAKREENQKKRNEEKAKKDNPGGQGTPAGPAATPAE